MRVCVDIPFRVEHTGWEETGVGIDAGGGNTNAGSEGHVVVKDAVCTAVFIQSCADLSNIVYDTDSKLFELLFGFVADLGVKAGQKTL
jgi:hypothetical protein